MKEKDRMKGIVLVIIAVLLGSTTYAESRVLDKAADWKASSYAKMENGTAVLQGKGYRFLESAAWMPIVSGAKYTLSAEVRSTSGKIEFCSITLALFDAEKKIIEPYSVCAYKDTETVLVAEAPAGTRIVRIKDGGKWKPSGYIAFHAKPDFSDLPNRTVHEIESVAKQGELYELTLKKPLSAGYPAGTAVRQHYWGGFWIGHDAAVKDPGNEWKKISGEMNGIVSKGGVKLNQFWPGTAFFHIIIHYRGTEDNSALEIRNVTLITKTAGESIFL